MQFTWTTASGRTGFAVHPSWPQHTCRFTRVSYRAGAMPRAAGRPCTAAPDAVRPARAAFRLPEAVLAFPSG